MAAESTSRKRPRAPTVQSALQSAPAAPKKKPRGRPRLTDEQKAENARKRAAIAEAARLQTAEIVGPTDAEIAEAAKRERIRKLKEQLAALEAEEAAL